MAFGGFFGGNPPNPHLIGAIPSHAVPLGVSRNPSLSVPTLIQDFSGSPKSVQNQDQHWKGCFRWIPIVPSSARPALGEFLGEAVLPQIIQTPTAAVCFGHSFGGNSKLRVKVPLREHPRPQEPSAIHNEADPSTCPLLAPYGGADGSSEVQETHRASLCPYRRTHGGL